MLNPLYKVVAQIVVAIHAALAPVFGTNSGASWALSIVLLTVAMRLVLFPLFVKQIKTQRAMQVLQPKMKELQKKYKGDRERLNQELMALYREHGANPLAGCLPLVLQLPIFFALFHTLNTIKPKLVHGHYVYPAHAAGFPEHLIVSAAQAKVFGVPLAAAFTSKPALLHFLHASATSTKVLSAILIVVMGATTFVTSRQLMANTSATLEGAQATQQKVMLYVLPLFFAVIGVRFQLGVLLYWLTTNVWSMGQQAVVIRRMGPAGGAAAAPAVAPPGTKPAPGARPAAGPKPPPGSRLAGGNGTRPAVGGGDGPKPPPASGDGEVAPGDAPAPAPAPAPTPAPAGAGRRPAQNRNRRTRSRRRRH